MFKERNHIFWDYNLILMFLPLLSPPHIFPVHLFLLFQIHFLISLIGNTCMHIFVYTYISKYNLLIPQSVICVYVFRADSWTQNNQCMLFRGQGHISCSQFFLVVCSTLCMVEASCACLHPVWLDWGVFWLQLTFGQLCLWRFKGVASDVTRGCNPNQ